MSRGPKVNGGRSKSQDRRVKPIRPKQVWLDFAGREAAKKGVIGAVPYRIKEK